jgi:hypothetical protein
LAILVDIASVCSRIIPTLGLPTISGRPAYASHLSAGPPSVGLCGRVLRISLSASGFTAEAGTITTVYLPPAQDENAASMALLQSWLAEEATDDPDEMRQAQEELDAFKRAINAEREQAGARRLYP